jgi:two-component system cell cycle response regulator
MSSRPPLLFVDRKTKLTLSSERPSTPKQACLVVMSGPAAGQRFDLKEDETIIGRGEECAVRIVADSVSRRHAVITRVLDRWIVLDLESTNGTFVDETRIERAELLGGESLRVGKVALKYTCDGLELDYMQHVLDVANTDALTGLYNRAYFDALLTSELARAAATGEPGALVLFDVDHFKSINDDFGHPAGDVVLSDLAALAKAQLEHGELLFRTGGEEFAVLISGASPARARKTAELLRRAVESATFNVGATPVRVTVSLGVAPFQPGEESAGLYQRADELLYAAKRAGRNRVS